MKNIVLTMITIIITAASVMSQDFRKATWGMSPSEVKSSETAKLIQEDSDFIVYETTLAGYKAYAGFIFTNGKLVRATYILKEYHSNDNDYITDYNRLNELLKKKYGEPVEDEEYWKTDHRPDKQYWGSSINRGELVLYSTFRTSTTEIEIALSAEDYSIENVIQYTSISDELKNLEEDKMLEDF